jgi:tetratricopeptide (TPR) repeat protein
MKRVLIPAALLASAVSAAPQGVSRDAAWQAFDVWTAAITSHTPGRNDEALTSFLKLSTSELEAAFPNMVWTLRAARARDGHDVAFDDVMRPYAIAERRPDAARLEAASEQLRKSDFATFLKRAAILHTDVALVSPDAHRTFSAGTGQHVSDGRRLGNEGRPWHWLLARAFLHLLPDPRDADVRLWYQTAANHLWSTRDFAELMPHMRRAQEIFPDDAELSFMNGLTHESNAAPHVQAAVMAQQFVARTTPGAIQRVVSTVGKENVEQALARDAFKRALDRDPSHVEARLRLGRMLALTGQPDAGIAELRTAVAAARAPQLVYMGQLFLGRTLEARGQFADARAAYEAAARAYPRAQAPRLALSQLALRTGDRAAADALLQLLRTPSTDDDDPWWRYYYEREPLRDEWLKRLWTAFRKDL